MTQISNNYNTILELLQETAVRYRKEISSDQLHRMTKTTSDTLKSVPNEMLKIVFEEAFKNNKYFPNEKQLLREWYNLESEQRGGSGYFDSFGGWTPEGTFYTLNHCPTGEFYLQSESREVALRIKSQCGVLTDEEKAEWEQIKDKKIYPTRGQIQKEFKDWNVDDHGFQEKFLEPLNAKIEGGTQYRIKMLNGM